MATDEHRFYRSKRRRPSDRIMGGGRIIFKRIPKQVFVVLFCHDSVGCLSRPFRRRRRTTWTIGVQSSGAATKVRTAKLNRRDATERREKASGISSQPASNLKESDTGLPGAGQNMVKK